jgi:hypothetical protein
LRGFAASKEENMNRADAPAYRAFYVPDTVDPDEAVRLGLAWLLRQAGEPLVLFHAKLMVSNNRTLERAIRARRIRFEAPRDAQRW